MENAEAVNAVRDLARQATLPRTDEAIHYVVAPAGSTLLSLLTLQYPHGLPPDRIIAAPRFQDGDSFCKYVNTFKDDGSKVFANAETRSFLAALDYHQEDGIPAFVSHKANFELKYSPEFKLWYGLHDKLVSQNDFAEFLEDNRADIVRPDAATMLEIAKDLQAHSEVTFASKVNTVNGAAVLNYEEQIKATVSTGRIEVPETFTIRIPVFFGELPQEITARLRFRISDGKLKFQFKLYRPEETIAKAFEATRAVIAAAVDLDVLLGSLS
jgi:uncharacterized protein YfdQ (DUF2303 family)